MKYKLTCSECRKKDTSECPMARAERTVMGEFSGFKTAFEDWEGCSRVEGRFIKPPLGPSPYWFVYEKRAKELAEAIEQYLDYIKQYGRIEDQTRKWKAVYKWAEELAWISEVITVLNNREEQQ